MSLIKFVLKRKLNAVISEKIEQRIGLHGPDWRHFN
jgi:hypothetical protein